MTNRYRPISVVGKATYGEEEFDTELTPAEERDALNGGHLELVPRTYRVLSDNYEAGKEGETFEATYLVEIESALIQGSHIERVDAEPVIVGEPGPELFTPDEPGTEVPAPKNKKED